uniref:F-box/LRR-repeat protein 15 n=1 Tax=Gallus gallus TaxID=9031 RepID=A0A8V0ZFG7_CHICK
MSLTPSRGCLLDLPWEDILVPHVLCHLPLQQLLGLQRVSKAFQALVQLYLANMRCFDSSQIGLAVPRAAFLNLLKDNKVLQQLELQNCSDWLTDRELLPVITRNHHLHHIQLKGCAQLSCHALMVISLNCPNLRRLSLAHCEWVDSLSLRSLADRCKALEAVDLTACRQLKDEAICYLVQKCSRLKSLSLAVNANVGDVAVEETAKCCPELEHLDLTGCLRVKNDSIRSRTAAAIGRGDQHVTGIPGGRRNWLLLRRTEGEIDPVGEAGPKGAHSSLWGCLTATAHL